MSFLSKEQAQYINERHVDLDREHRASKFLHGFNLTSTLGFLTGKMFQDSDDYHIIEEGHKRSHGYFYIYMFKMKKVIGVSVGLSHGRDLHLLFVEGGIRREIEDYFSTSVFKCLLLIPEAQKEWSGTLLESSGSSRSLLVSTNGS